MYILFDIGGTKMRIAGSKTGISLDRVAIEKNAVDDFEEGMALFKELAEEVSKGEKIEGVAGGIAGPLNREKSALLNAPNIRGWIGKPLKKRLEDEFQAPALIENDAALVGLGEAVYGAGRGFDIVSYITVSTGVGGARIVRGRIDESAYGFEPGHHIIEMGGTECPGCGAPGDLESYISGTGLQKHTGKNPKDIPQDDPVWSELARVLAVGLHNVSVMWSPDVLVVGGSMIVGSPAISLRATEHHLKEIMHIFPAHPPIRKAELKDEGGLYGALALVGL